ncbi:hypothetical protein J2X01_001946 [Arthrobacter ginsengisoli]|uniref:Calcium-binding protein n=1 Tax=Arthrobacter ginsengisoli TaxID=1356565 RepID=A0ABU1UBS6_9MICC|nr:hypothetical protein [Arthrobacter ginsengisoli]MDR7082657.1 hypothetical protein [Arthrobacter ginsengisoli]
MSKKSFVFAAGATAFAASLALASPAAASVTFDPATGTGFVGKGDVQTVFEWSNKTLQTHASTVDFRVNSVNETTWTCTKTLTTGNGQTKEIVQERRTTTSVQGLVATVPRSNSNGKDGPVTGFSLQGYEGTATLETDGPAVGTCPAAPSGFVYDQNAQTAGSGGGLEVTYDGTSWYSIG